MSQYLRTLEPVAVAWNTRDNLLFANSIGCTELMYLYEDHEAFRAFPTYPLMLSFKHGNTSTIPFREHFGRYINVQIPGVPRLDSTKAVDGGRSLRIYHPLPSSSRGRHFKLRTLVEDVSDKGFKGTVVVLRHVLFEEVTANVAQVFAEISETVFYVGQGNWGGPKGVTPSKLNVPYDKEPILIHRHQITTNAHLLYRLNGDYNPLHADPNSSSASAFGGVIMHGLYTWNVAARVILEEVPKLKEITTYSNTSGFTLAAFEGRFLSMVRPGDTLHISVWTRDGGLGMSKIPGATQTRLSLVYSVRVEGNEDAGPCLIGWAELSLGDNYLQWAKI